MTPRRLELRARHRSSTEIDPPHVVARTDWDPEGAAVIICDMWDAHHCVSAERRVAAMAPRANAVAAALRAEGALIIHAPSDCMDYYRAAPQRRRAVEAPAVVAPVPIDWNGWDHEPDAPVPSSLTDPGPCSCNAATPCGPVEPTSPYPWTSQISLIGIADEDAISDDGQEVFNLLESRGIRDVIVMGVHTNMCVLGRPFGIRQLVYLGKRPTLCRDLTDSFHRDPRGHAWGTEQIVAHIERRWCPSVTSDQLAGGAPFHFAEQDL
jgi:nicotinamidase-related amidase